MAYWARTPNPEVIDLYFRSWQFRTFLPVSGQFKNQEFQDTWEIWSATTSKMTNLIRKWQTTTDIPVGLSNDKSRQWRIMRELVFNTNRIKMSFSGSNFSDSLKIHQQTPLPVYSLKYCKYPVPVPLKSKNGQWATTVPSNLAQGGGQDLKQIQHDCSWTGIKLNGRHLQAAVCSEMSMGLN